MNALILPLPPISSFLFQARVIQLLSSPEQEVQHRHLLKLYCDSDLNGPCPNERCQIICIYMDTG